MLLGPALGLSAILFSLGVAGVLLMPGGAHPMAHSA